MIRFLGVAAVILLVVGVFLYSQGWLEVRSSPQNSTIELKTDQIKHAADSAVKEGERMVNEATAPTPVPPAPTPVVPAPTAPAPVLPAP